VRKRLFPNPLFEFTSMGRNRSRHAGGHHSWRIWFETHIPPEPLYAVAIIFLVSIYAGVTETPSNARLELYKFPTGQPFSDFVSSHLPFSASIMSVLTLSSVGIFLLLGGIDFFVSTMAALFVLFDPSVSTMCKLTGATGIQLFFEIATFHCANQAFARTPRTLPWYVYQLISWFFAVGSILFNLDTLSVPISLFCQYLASSAIVAVREKKRTGFLHNCLANVLIALPFVIAGIVFIRSEYVAPFRVEAVDAVALWREFMRPPGTVAFVLTVVLPFVIAPIAGAFQRGLVMCPGLFLCALLTVTIPIKHSGESLAMKVVAAKIVLLIAGDLRYGLLKNVWYSRGLSLFFTGAVLVVMIMEMRNIAQESPPGPLGIRVPTIQPFL
jgi:hypothetical protein